MYSITIINFPRKRNCYNQFKYNEFKHFGDRHSRVVDKHFYLFCVQNEF